MDGCTFQPNTRRSSASSRAATVGSSALDPLLEGDGRRGNDVFKLSPTRNRAREGAASQSAAMVGKRLFEESKRLRERRFEGEERKRMGEEEAFERTCTFQVCAYGGRHHFYFVVVKTRPNFVLHCVLPWPTQASISRRVLLVRKFLLTNS